MNEWWNNLNDFQRFFAYIALPATLFSLLQTILLILGFADLDFDIETDHDVDIDEVSGLKFFSIKGILAFCTFFGWVGIILSNQGISKPIVCILALGAGFIAMALMAMIFFVMAKLQSKGNINYENAIGEVGEVYLKIPPLREGFGKINVLIQERFVEVNAVTDDENTINTGEKVRIIDMIDTKELLVVRDENFNILK